MKSSWTCCVARYLPAALLLAVLVPAPPAVAKKKGRLTYSPEELTNVFIGPEYSRWLVGGVALMATESEIESYLGLRKDSEAAEFIESFWQRRDPHPQWPGNRVLEEFQERAAEADQLYRQGAIPGRRTDRGAIYIVFGEPEEVEYEIPPHQGMPPIEVWKYPKDAPEGLNGEKPDRRYRFIERDGRTVLYVPLATDRLQRPPR